MKGNLMKGKMKGHFRKGKKGTVHELEFILVFRFDGQLILPYMTPAQLEMEDGDVVDVFQARLS